MVPRGETVPIRIGHFSKKKMEVHRHGRHGGGDGKAPKSSCDNVVVWEEDHSSKAPKSSRRNSTKRKKAQLVKLPVEWTWDLVADHFKKNFNSNDVKVIANEIVLHKKSYSEACKSHPKNKIVYNSLYTNRGLLWLGVGHKTYWVLKASVTRLNASVKRLKERREHEEMMRMIQDILNKLNNKCKSESLLQNRVVDKENMITDLKSKHTSCKKQMVKHRNKAKSKQEQLDWHKKVNIMCAYTRPYTYLI